MARCRRHAPWRICSALLDPLWRPGGSSAERATGFSVPNHNAAPLGAPPPCRRPGCTFLTVDVRLECPEEAGTAPLARTASGGSGSGGGSGAAGGGPSQDLLPTSSKQLDGSAPNAGAGGEAGTDGGRAAALLHSLTAQVLQRRSMGIAASASPLLAQLNTQQLVAAAGGRMLRSLPTPADAPTQAANATSVPQLPRLSAVSPACLVLPPLAGATAPEPPVIVLTGQGLFAHTGRPGLVLARQHGETRCWCRPSQQLTMGWSLNTAGCIRHTGCIPGSWLQPCSLLACLAVVPLLGRAPAYQTSSLAPAIALHPDPAGRHLAVEVWGSSDGGAAGPGALVVSVVGLQPGVCELEVQRGSVLGSSRPLLVLPAGMEAPAAELAALGGGSSAGADAFLRDVGAVVAWVELHGRQAAAAAGVRSFDTSGEDTLSSGSGSDAEMGSEAEEEWEIRQQPDADMGEAEAAAVGQQAAGSPRLVPSPPPLPRPLLPADHVVRLARHAARFALRCGWEACAAALESAAAAATAAVAAGAAAASGAAMVPVAPAPGWVPGSSTLQRDEHALDFEFWAPLWQQQLEREGQAAPAAATLTAWWQPAAASEAAGQGRQQLPEERYWVEEEGLKGQAAVAAATQSGLAGWRGVAAVAAVLSTAAALSALCWG